MRKASVLQSGNHAANMAKHEFSKSIQHIIFWKLKGRHFEYNLSISKYTKHICLV